MYKLGFTGTQHGMTEAQTTTLWLVLRANHLRNAGGIELHHGDCIGADAQAHDHAKELGMRVVIHPPTNPKKRAFKEGADETLPPDEYLVRNRAIVDATTGLVGCPAEMEEQSRGGTWSTIRYAASRNKDVVIIFPDGVIKNWQQLVDRRS